MVALKDNLVGSWRLGKYEELPVDGSPMDLAGLLGGLADD